MDLVEDASGRSRIGQRCDRSWLVYFGCRQVRRRGHRSRWNATSRNGQIGGCRRRRLYIDPGKFIGLCGSMPLMRQQSRSHGRSDCPSTGCSRKRGCCGWLGHPWGIQYRCTGSRSTRYRNPWTIDDASDDGQCCCDSPWQHGCLRERFGTRYATSVRELLHPRECKSSNCWDVYFANRSSRKRRTYLLYLPTFLSSSISVPTPRPLSLVL